MKPKPQQTANGAAPQPSLSYTASTTSISSQRNRTFLNIDSILYPKETKKTEATKKRRPGLKHESLNVISSDAGMAQYQDVPGLKGYGKSGARVSQILSELNAKHALEKAQTNIQKEKET